MKKEEFINSLIFTTNSQLNTLNSIKNSVLPLVLFGTGNYAKTVFKFLLKKGIYINSACVDSLFYIENLWNGIQVYPLDEIDDEIGQFNVLIGVADFKVAKDKIQNLKGCNQVFFLDSVSFFNLISYDFVISNIDAFFNLYNSLEDILSKNTLIAYLNGKISGVPSDLYELYVSDQYFPEDIIKLSEEEVFIDVGAYTGDTVLLFLEKTKNKYKEIFAFEPDHNSFFELEKNINIRDIKNITIYESGLWDVKTVLKFKIDFDSGVKSAFSDDGTILLNVESLDTLLDRTFATYIKMDIEGAELKALKGAKKNIKESKPKLAISMYHKAEDLITIPNYIKDLVPEYKLYLRHHMPISQELVLYAII